LGEGERKKKRGEGRNNKNKSHTKIPFSLHHLLTRISQWRDIREGRKKERKKERKNK
jgi:hypothetical protein